MDKAEDLFDGLITMYARRFFPEEWARESAPLLIKAQIWQESRFNPHAQSPSGAQGLMQLMPGTAREMRLDTHEVFDPEKNIEAGVGYDRIQYERFPEIPDRDERLRFMLAAYNCGRGYVNQALRLAREEEFGFQPLATVAGKWQTWKFSAKLLASPKCMVGGRKSDFVQVWDYVEKIWKKYREYSLEFGVRSWEQKTKEGKTMEKLKRAARPRLSPGRIGYYVVAVSILALIGIVACALPQKAPEDPFAYDAYRFLSTSATSYKTINGTFTEFRAAGLISDAGWAEYEKMGNKFVDEHQALSKAMAEYKRGEKPQSAVELVQKALQKILAELKEYYLSKIPKEQQKPLF